VADNLHGSDEAVSREGGPRPRSSPSQVTPRTVVVVILVAAAVLGGLYLLWQLRQLVGWCLVGLFLAAALDPVVDRLQRAGIKRGLAIGLTYLGLLVAIVALGALVMPLLIDQTRALIDFAITLSQQPEGWLGFLRDLADRYSLGWVVDALGTQSSDLPRQLGQSVENFLLSTGGLLASAVGFVAAFITILVVAFFLLLDGERFLDLGLRLLAEPQRSRVRLMLERSAEAVSGYVTGNLAISLICGVGVYIVLILLGMPYALTLALIVAVLDVIPQIGAPLGGALLVIFGLTIDPWASLILLIYFVVYQMVENYILTPVVYSRSVHQHPLVVFIAVLAGGLLFGVLGALLAIPVVEVLRIVGAEWLSSRTASRAQETKGSDGE
jgi:predicted PurR-regulated permease PerM